MSDAGIAAQRFAFAEHGAGADGEPRPSGKRLRRGKLLARSVAAESPAPWARFVSPFLLFIDAFLLYKIKFLTFYIVKHKDLIYNVYYDNFIYA